jgi:tocopherol O-methyltransferase
VSKDSARYFDENYGVYASGWSADHLHYGFWHADTADLEQSLTNTVIDLLAHLELKKGDRVLDAGCGTGGTCRYIAEHFALPVTGITFSKKLLAAARILSRNCPNRKLIRYYFRDYARTGFKQCGFTRIIALESLCHGESKESFLREAFRLLGPGGRLIVADYFLDRDDLTPGEQTLCRQWLDGWAIPDLPVEKKLAEAARGCGFMSVRCVDKTSLIRKSSRIMWEAGRASLTADLLAVKEGKAPPSRVGHTIALIRQKECLDLGIWKYCFFIADR